ncbi:MAG TPA: hypothetical protein VIT23_08230, partial [Terrimicrobiaceae bacterium]
AQNTLHNLSARLQRIYERFPQEKKKRVREATQTWLRSRGVQFLRRRPRPPSVIGMISQRRPGKLFEFLRSTLQQSGAFDLRDTINADCQHYLIDAGWLENNDSKRLADLRVAWVCDHFVTPLPSNVMVVPSFKALSERPKEQSAARPLVIPPLLDGEKFDPQIPIPDQLTSTIAGVRQAIQQLFLVLESPNAVRWLGFR